MSNNNIAVIAVAGCFSGCTNVEDYWQMIANAKSGLRRFTKEECRELGVPEHILQDERHIPVSGHVENMDQFDELFWGLSAHEAQILDPQIRKLLEQTWYVLDEAGYARDRNQHAIAVVVGSSNSIYLHDNLSNFIKDDHVDFWEANIANNKDSVATKLSYLLGLKGEGVSINTACSTGLTTIIEACYKLSSRQCDLVVAGSTSLLLPHQVGHLYQQGMIMSMDGHCRTFDRGASGTINGSGVGAVLLKRLTDAEKHKDNIIAVIKGYALNNDGDRKISYTAPSVEGQAECIAKAITMAAVDSSDIGYVECHGTATKLGDPIEVEALNVAFTDTSLKKRAHRCQLGAVKANIGHADSAAGLAGFIKVCLMLKHGVIPKQIDYNVANPDLHLNDTVFEVSDTTKEWVKDNGKSRIAGVSSFGIGGTNAHVVLEEYAKGDHIMGLSQQKSQEENGSYILPITAKTKKSLECYVSIFTEYLISSKSSLHDIIYTLQKRRCAFAYRIAIDCRDKEEAIDKLKSQPVVKSNLIAADAMTVFVFPGQGTQYADMGLSLYQHDRDYQQVVDRCIDYINRHIKEDFKGILFPSLNMQGNCELIHQTKWAQPALFVTSFALATLLEKMGVKADCFIGHSVGEYVAAVLSGVIRLEDAIEIVLLRGMLMQQMPIGAMLSINLTEDKVKAIVEQYECEIAVVNAPNYCVVSGVKDKIIALKEHFDGLEISSSVLKTSHAYHSSLMEKAAQKYKEAIDKITFSLPKREFISNISGLKAGVEVTSAEYWAEHIRRPVQFSNSIATIISNTTEVVFVEVGVGNALTTFIQAHKDDFGRQLISIDLLPSAKDVAKASVEHSKRLGLKNKNELMARLWSYGYPVDFVLPKIGDVVNLPYYQFERNVHWIALSEERAKCKLSTNDDMFYLRSWQTVAVQPQGSMRSKCRTLVIVNGKRYLQQAREFLTKLDRGNFDVVFLILRKGNKFKRKRNVCHMDIDNHSHIRWLTSFLNTIKLYENISQSFYFSSHQVDEACAFERIFGHIYRKISKQHTFISITYDNYDVVDKENLVGSPSVVASFNMAMPIENSNISACHLDLALNDPNDLSQYIDIIDVLQKQGDIYALRYGKVWRLSYEKSQTKPQDLNNFSLFCRSNANYLITGGLGGVGYSIAKTICHQASDAKIVLIGRKKEEQLKGNALSRLNDLQHNANNNQIYYVNFNIGWDPIAELVYQLKDREVDRLFLLLHAAGVAAQSAVKDVDLERVREITMPKTSGTISLLSLVDFIPSDYFIACSSLASVVPSYGNWRYAAANSYLDEISYRHHEGVGRFLTINFNQISDIGMAYDFINKEQKPQLFSLNSIKSSEISTAIDNAVCLDVNQVVFSKYDVKQLGNQAYCVETLNMLESGSVAVYESCTDIQRQIAEIFCQVLAISAISVEDNFFDLGGNSLLAIQLISILRQRLNINISLADIVQHNTVAKIATYSGVISDQTKTAAKLTLNQSSIMLTLMDNQADQNVFFIHPVGGTVMCYMPLIRELPITYNYYGLQNINIYKSDQLRVDSLEELAEVYLKEILKIQPTGKYILIGASMGGTIAYEIALQLQRMGKTIKRVLMFDTWIVFAPCFYNKDNLSKMLSNCSAAFYQISSLQIKNVMSASCHMMQLNLDYQPKDHSRIPVTLYKAATLDENHAQNGNHKDNGWLTYTSGLRIRKALGDHLSIINEQNSQKLALQVVRELKDNLMLKLFIWFSDWIKNNPLAAMTGIIGVVILALDVFLLPLLLSEWLAEIE
ncbi:MULTISPECIES: type I polyketide synthase [Cysteiniphilum]|uniref:Polyketide synthase n=1 Tax=Cysteiniphilum litorale TaxID=2056700 RepID=A0A8J3E7X0_9GAMM|nr:MULTISPECIES: type I polyketide synthase [Cysteiniphilum]GGF93615.1 hypothetical protein GCM10010995_08500 [Cysteiniphilum litorale]